MSNSFLEDLLQIGKESAIRAAGNGVQSLLKDIERGAKTARVIVKTVMPPEPKKVEIKDADFEEAEND